MQHLWSQAYQRYAYPHCSDCTAQCTEPTCSTSSELTSQCTDQCVVITCSDPEHDALNCTDGHSQCDLVCDDTTDCTDCSGLDALLRCCEEYHPRYTDTTCDIAPPHHYHHHHQEQQQQQQQQNVSHYNWDSSLADVLCGCNQPTEPDIFHSHVTPSTTNASLSPAVATSDFPSTNPRYSPPSTSNHSSHQYNAEISVLQIQPPTSTAIQYHSPQTPQSRPLTSAPILTCMWGSCQARFTSLSELVGHVNLQHLRLPTDSEVSSDPSSRTLFSVHSQQADATIRLPCLWRNCTDYLPSELFPGCPDSNSTDSLLSNLASHLLQEHLRVQALGGGYQSTPESDQILAEKGASRQQEQGQRNQEPQAHFGQGALYVATTSSASSEISGQGSDGPPLGRQDTIAFAPLSPQTTTTAISSPTVSVVDVPGEAHVCRWDSCGMTFETCDDLMTHLSVIHVGSGKPQYDCLWEGCTRNRSKGFSSKQKICRHLQSHTGYRPFQCPECHQNFSEAATLQQHIRRHTQEKPYKCDFPGCGKSFAITGALTIHKRTHNGLKPFKCTYCDRAFAESSNLSKHLRTHTGERPYVCHEPGCGKAFARPDQLTRHAGIHRKRAVVTTAV